MKPVDAIIGQGREIRTIERGRLFRKYFLLILALVCGALLISGGIGIYFSYQENKFALSSLQREKAVAAAVRIEQFIRQIEQQLAFAALPQLGAEGMEQRRIEFLKLQRLVPAITDTTQIDARGRERLAVSRLGMDVVDSGIDRSGEPAFKGAKSDQTWFGPVYFRKETEPYMSIAVRSKGEAGAVTVADVNLKFIWDVVTRIKIGKKGKAYVVDGTGHLVADPDIGLVLRKTDHSLLPQVKYAMQKDSDDSRALVARDLAGEPVLTAYGSIEPLGWKVFVEQPVSEVYATLDAAILRTVALMVAGLLFSILAAMWLARSMVRPIRTLQDGAARIGAGDLDQRIEVKTGDELESLAEQFNQMMVQLRESYAGLERKVEERTAELQETLKQQTATAEVLKLISRSTFDLKPVLDALVQSAAQLCEAQYALFYRIEPGGLKPEAWHNVNAEYIAYRKANPIPLRNNYVMGRVALSGQPVHVHDVLADPEYGAAAAQQLGEYRTVLGVPVLREGEPIGTIAVFRREVLPFGTRQIQLLTTFADQAAIAIENVRLFNETKEALERQTATSEVLRVIGGSVTDVQPVFDIIAERAARLTRADYGWVFRFDGESLHVASSFGVNKQGLEAARKAFPMHPGGGSVSSRVVLDGKVVNVADVLAEPDSEYTVKQIAEQAGYRSVLGVPMIRDQKTIGVVTVTRAAVGTFAEKEIDLLRTFADQAVIAIENVRLFNETKESLEQQTATSEILRVISSSPTDVQPVFEAIARSGLNLFDNANVWVVLRVGDSIQAAAISERDPERVAKWRAAFPTPLTHDYLNATAILDNTIVDLEDVAALPKPLKPGTANFAATGYRAVTITPMMRGGEAIGAIGVARLKPGRLSDKQVALLKTFADQAVIAIQNVRLFNEIQEKGRQLEIANQHKSDFLANMSHELRTPLNAIIGFSEVLVEKMFGEVNDKQLDYLKDIHSSGRHLLSLINDILDLSKIEAGRMELDISDFDLRSALENAMTLVKERAQRSGITLSLEVDPALGMYRGDERKFKQILLNLLSNAVKFTPEGGKVGVAARPAAGVVEVSVADTGVGIAETDQKLVFEEFKQVGSDYTRKAEGTGLGLALTKRFVELHGGTIRLESAPGKGSTFTFTIPLGL